LFKALRSTEDRSMPVALTPNLAWLLLVVAGLLEIVWSVSMKASHGFTKHHFTAITIIAAWLSFWLLGLALRQLPVGTAYAVWTGIGAVGAAILGIAIFGESLSAARIGCIALIVCGILGLKLPGEAQPDFTFSLGPG
jgi:quaternary ammonium compound-resistance protein SugE